MEVGWQVSSGQTEGRNIPSVHNWRKVTESHCAAVENLFCSGVKDSGVLSKAWFIVTFTLFSSSSVVCRQVSLNHSTLIKTQWLHLYFMVIWTVRSLMPTKKFNAQELMISLPCNIDGNDLALTSDDFGELMAAVSVLLCHWSALFDWSLCGRLMICVFYYILSASLWSLFNPQDTSRRFSGGGSD